MRRGQPVEALATRFQDCSQSSNELLSWIQNRCEDKGDKARCSELLAEVPKGLESCIVHERANYDCALGTSLDTLGAQANISIVERQELSLAKTREGSTIARLQLAELAKSVFGSAGSESELIAQAKDGKIQRIEFYDISQDQGYTALIARIDEGDRGLVFRRKTTKSVALVKNGDFIHPETGALSCRAPLGDAGRMCSESKRCPEGQACTGAAPSGVCIRREQDVPDQACSTHDSCYPGYCTGRTSGYRSCAPGWMFGESLQKTKAEVREGEPTLSHLSVLGQASVPLDLELFVSLSHPIDVAQLSLELLIPASFGQSEEERPSLRVWPAEAIESPRKRAQLVIPIHAFGDESINGRWSLRAKDLFEDGQEGEILEWALRYSSRWD